ncbi:MAG: hypothetical protein QM680_10895 [Luteolibacter sp.]
MTLVKTIIALMLGLTFQLAQVHGSELPDESARMQASTCPCNHCTCVENTTPHQRPAPAIAAESLQKNVALHQEKQPLQLTAPVASTPVFIPDGERAFVRFTGYPGVGVPVAFCSFLL